MKQAYRNNLVEMNIRALNNLIDEYNSDIYRHERYIAKERAELEKAKAHKELAISSRETAKKLFKSYKIGILTLREYADAMDKLYQACR